MFHKHCKLVDFPIDAFIELGRSVTDIFVTAGRKLSASQEAWYSKERRIGNFNEWSATSTDESNDFQKYQNQKPIPSRSSNCSR